MNLDANLILASLIVSSLGFVSFVYGKKQARVPQMLAGLILLIYPYFVSNLWIMLGAAVAVLAGLWVAVRYGW
jgi:hypothetical protein